MCAKRFCLLAKTLFLGHDTVFAILSVCLIETAATATTFTPDSQPATTTTGNFVILGSFNLYLPGFDKQWRPQLLLI